MSSPTRYPNGLSTNRRLTTFGQYPLPSRLDIVEDLEDFNQYVAADWTVTNTTSHNTIGLVAASSTIPSGGVLGLVAGGSTANNDYASVQANPLNIYFGTSSEVWFETHLRCANASNEAFMTGIATSISTLAPSDGIYFSKAAAAATVDFVVRTSSTSTTQASVTTLVASTNTRLGFYYNGKNAIDVFVDRVKVYSQTVLTNLPVSVAMGSMFGWKASATAPTSAAYYTDYILAAQSRTY